MSASIDEIERLITRFKANPPRVVLSRADAYDEAARHLERQANALEMTALLLARIGAAPGDSRYAEVVAHIRAEAVAPDLQVAAMREAARAIRELSIEDRLVAARAAGEQDRTR